MGFSAPTGNGPWQGGDGGLDRQEAERALRLLLDPDGYHELVAPPWHAAQVGWFKGDEDGIAAAAEHAARLHAAEPAGVYLGLNPAGSAKAGRAKDGDIARRRWLFLDFDAARPEPKATNATDEEKHEARESAIRCHDVLVCDQGWPEPVVVDSGNGWYLLWRIDAPSDATAKAAIQRATKLLAGLYGCDPVVYNAGRVCRLPGTINRKGPDEPGRPRRPCRLYSVPGAVEAVPWARLLALAGPEGGAKAGSKAGGLGSVPTGSGGAGGPPALERARAYLRRTPPAYSGQGGHPAAFWAARVVVWGFDLGEQAGYDLLWSEWNPHCRPPWSERELRHKCQDADRVPFDKPRGWMLEQDRRQPGPEAGPSKSKAGDKQEGQGEGAKAAGDGEERIVYQASRVEPRKVEWLWRHRVPLGKLTTFAGNGGLGKTFVLCDMTARVTTGRDWPDGEKAAAPGNVLFISGEDEPEDTLVPRLIALEADLSRVWFLTEPAMSRFTLAHLPMLTAGLEQAGGEVRLVVIDPPTAYLAGVDDHKNAELRMLLSPLAAWAAKHKAAVVFNTHVNKGGAAKTEAIARVMGSVAWVNAVRAAHLFAKDAEEPERRVFIPMKSNLGKARKGLAYRLAEIDDDMAKVEWLGEVDTTADQAASSFKPPKRSEVAKEWLIGRFRQKREWPSAELYKDAKACGISRSALWEAKEGLEVKARKVTHEGGDTEWLWLVPEDWPHFAAGGKAAPGGDGNGDTRI